MSIEPKPSWYRNGLLWIWLTTFVALVILMAMVGETISLVLTPSFMLVALLVSFMGATFLLAVWLLVRRPWSWRNGRRAVMIMAALGTLAGVLYTVENVRGKRAWETCKRELEAKGAVLDWNAYIPPPVPDEQNILKAPKMTEWFVGRGLTDLTTRLGIGRPWETAPDAAPMILAELTVTTPEAHSKAQPSEIVWQLDDPAIQSRATRWLDDLVGPHVSGSQSILIVARAPARIPPVRIQVQAPRTATVKDLQALFPRRGAVTPVRVELSGQTNSFRIILSAGCTAADYLAWSDRFEPDLHLIREALKRPYARMDGDYQQPFAISIPNFVTLRMLAQTLAQRAQCHLLRGEPDKAVRELELIRDLSRLLEGKPSGQPMTLVAAMINVAITGLYVDTIADGFRLQSWREPQLAALARQLKGINLPVPVRGAYECEPAAVCRTVENTPADQLIKMFFGSNSKDSLFARMRAPLLKLAPGGWRYQNMATVARLQHQVLDSFDATRRLIRPREMDQYTREIENVARRRSLYTVLASIAVPNYSRATQTTARNQTLADQAGIACALERYRLAHGQYPETLDALKPQFIDKLPHDPIGGQPLKYRRSEDRFVLYSVGWNETDDSSVNVPGSPDKGDWAWPPAK